jgi:hypothetical protein
MTRSKPETRTGSKNYDFKTQPYYILKLISLLEMAVHEFIIIYKLITPALFPCCRSGFSTTERPSTTA